MAPKRVANSSAPPPPPPLVASSAETDSRSRSEELEDEETSDVSLTATSDKTPPALREESEESETSDEEEEEEEEEDDPPRVESLSAIKNQPLPQQGQESDASDEEDEEGETESEEEAPPTKLAPEQKAVDLKPPSAVEAKKQGAYFRRVWSAEDEVRILETLAAYRQEHGVLPHTDAIVDTLAGSLDNTSFGSKELLGKVKTLKSRFHTLSRRPEIPIKEHDRRLLDISKIVWGPEVGAPKKDSHAPRDFGDMCETYPYLAEEVNQLDAAHPELFKIPFGMLDDETASKLDAKIKKERVLRTRVEMRRNDLAKEVTKTLLELL